MRILVISSTPWSNNNSFGNTFSNFFEGIPDLEFANIYCKPGIPDNKLNMIYYQITEKMLIKNLINPLNETGRIVSVDHKNHEEKAVWGFENARKKRWQIFIFARDLIWKFGRWNSRQFRCFLDEFHPDLIFQPIYFSSYLNAIALFVQEYTGAPMLGYISDDNYTLKKLRYSPLFWVDRLVKRRIVKKAIDKCKILYVISEIQKQEYEKIFSTPCKILTKAYSFDKELPLWSVSECISMIYAGNLGNGRVVSLGYICSAVSELRSQGVKIKIDIYSNTYLSKTEADHLSLDGCVLHPPIPYNELLEQQRKADILIHVEGLSLKSRLDTHQSFSTKLVDFFAMGKCIFAIGTDDEASISHLINNSAAVVASTKEEVYQKIKYLTDNPTEIIRYGKNAYECGKNHHRKETMQKMLFEDFEKVIKA